MLFLRVFFLLVMALLGAPEANGQAGSAGAPVFKDDLDRDSLRRAIHRSLEFVAKIPPDQPVGELPRRLTAREVGESLVDFLNLMELWDQPEALAREIRARFELYDAGGNREEDSVLFTGYYQPVIDGSLTETPEYRFPVYRRPDDLTLRYFSRHEIDGLGRLRGKGFEIAWVRDPVDLFFLHLQGSGILRLEDGRPLYLNYAASNGRPYTSIGRLLIESGKIPEEEISMQRLRRYLAERPEEREALFIRNERYVFFRFLALGPVGSLEVPLTAGRSVATDERLFPKGALAFIVSRGPVLDSEGNVVGWGPISRFVLNQDTGSAIRGLRRVDLYFGSGYRAGLAAGVMKSSGKIYFLIKKKAAGNGP